MSRANEPFYSSRPVFRSIRWRIAIPYVILTLLTMLGLGFYLSTFLRQTFLNSLETRLIGQGRLIADALARDPSIWEDPAELDNLAKHWAGLLGVRVTLVTKDGVVLGESHEDRRQMDNHLNRPEIQQAITSGQGSSTRFSQTVAYEMMYVAVPVRLGNDLAGFVRLALPVSQVLGDLARLQRILVVISVLVTTLTLILAATIAGRTTRPLRALTAAAGQLSSGTLSDPLETTSTDEVGQLTEAFNRMASRLEQQFRALETERGKLSAVLQELTDGVLMLDQGGQVQLINPAAEKIFRIRSEQAIGRSLIEVLRYHQLVELWRHTQDSGETQAVTLEIGAARLYLQGVAIPLGQALPGSTLFVFQNLTRLRQLETVRRDFISNISHELRTPLASLKALAETLQEGALDDPPAARRFLQRMEAEVDALSHMVSELLELSRIESGRVPLKMEATRPEDILSPAIERLQVQAERAGVSIQLDCCPAGLAPVLADQTRLEQVVVNLLHNAIKFTPSGGRITLKAEQQGERILFSVSDTGVGIPASDLPRIFERFYKADRARSTGGTGLGLAIARHMVEAHGGEIWAQSEAGRGSSFYFSIPLAH